jgi:TPR repeat protein
MEDPFHRAWALHDQGRKAQALRVFLAGAKRGDRSCQTMAGFFYDEGIGGRPNREKALYWYRRAYRRGDAPAAVNIGLIYKASGQTQRAIQWLQRALSLGDEDSALDLARIYADIDQAGEQTAQYLRMAADGKNVTEATREEARRLLQVARKKDPKRAPRGKETHRSSTQKRSAKATARHYMEHG